MTRYSVSLEYTVRSRGAPALAERRGRGGGNELAAAWGAEAVHGWTRKARSTTEGDCAKGKLFPACQTPHAPQEVLDAVCAGGEHGARQRRVAARQHVLDQLRRLYQVDQGRGHAVPSGVV